MSQAAAEAWAEAQREIEAERSTQVVLEDSLNSENEVYIPFINNTSRVQILFGGSSSGKSTFKARCSVRDVLSGKRNYLICRAVGRHNRHSTFAEVKRAITSLGVWDRFKINESDMVVTCDNKKQILFTGLDDTENLKSIVPLDGPLTDVWVEEATQCEQQAIRELTRRQRGLADGVHKRITLTFNPIYKTHWIYLEYFARIAWADDQKEYISPGLSILKTTHADNRFLDQADRDLLENEKDEYNYNVYTLGNWGVLGDVIFKNWRVEDLSGRLAQFTNHRNGLDFGFSSDPAAMPVTHYDRAHKTIYVYGELYERGLTNDVLANEIKALISRQYVTCDSAEPKSITELQGYGVNALPAQKGKDSVVFGIQWLQQQSIVVDAKCVNARAELSTYQWKKDKDGNSIRQPVDKMNHLIDGLRYAYEEDMEASGGFAMRYT